MSRVSVDFESRISEGARDGLEGSLSASASAEAAGMFRMKRVVEIKNIEVKLRREAEEKSAQLRNMLGTRYRDLIRTADEVSSMEQGVQRVGNIFLDVQKNARELQKSLETEIEQKFIKENRDEDDSQLLKQKAAQSIGTHLKYIVDTREHLFASLDNKKNFEASQRYSGAVAAKKALLEDQNKSLCERFIDLQWQGVAPFRQDIVDGSKRTLEQIGLEAKEYAGALCALVTVAEMSISAVLNELVDARMKWICDMLLTENSTPSNLFGSVASVLKDLLCDLHVIFFSRGDDADPEVLKIVSSAPSFAELDEHEIRRKIAEWLIQIKPTVDSHSKTCLSRAKTGAEVRSALEALEVLFDASNAELVKAKLSIFNSEAPSSLESILKPAVQQRAEDLTYDIIERAVSNFQREVTSTFTLVSEGKSADGNISKMIWSEDHAQVSGDRSASGAELLGRTGLASRLHDSFESVLKSAVLEDLSSIGDLVAEVAVTCRLKSSKALPRLIEEQRKLVKEFSGELRIQGVGDINTQSLSKPVEKLLLLGRICGNLSQSKPLTDLFCFGAVEGTNEYAEALKISESYRDEASAASVESYNAAFSAVAQELGSQLIHSITVEGALEPVRGWEKTSEDPSALTYPAMPSHTCFNFSMRGCRFVNYAGGFALPTEVPSIFAQSLMNEALKAYGNLPRLLADGKSSQNAMQQAVFDIKMLQSVFLGIEPDGGTPHSASDELMNLEKSLIAGIDVSVWTASEKLVIGAVKAAFMKSSIILGAFLRTHHVKRPALIRPSLTEGFRSSSLLVVATPAPRFQYLPAPLPSSYQRRVMSTKAALQTLEVETGGRVKASEIGSKDNQEETDVVAMASSFATNFGRISSQFFSGLGRDQAG